MAQWMSKLKSWLLGAVLLLRANRNQNQNPEEELSSCCVDGPEVEE